jgi:hypothetical protein
MGLRKGLIPLICRWLKRYSKRSHNVTCRLIDAFPHREGRQESKKGGLALPSAINPSGEFHQD